MLPVFEAVWQRADFWSLLALPVLAALLGWGSSWIAIRMIFGPLEFTGWQRASLGWQGILPSRAEKLAGSLADHTVLRFTRLSEIFRLMEPEKIADHVSQSLLLQADDYVDAIMAEKNAVFWDNVPAGVRQRVYARVRRQLPSIMDNLVDDMGQNMEELIDFRQFMVERLVAEPALLVAIYREVAEEDCRFLLSAGWRSGLLLGGVELCLWLLLPHRWLLLCLPLLIGALAFWLSRWLLFSSTVPAGLMLVRRDSFANRRAAVATMLSERLAEEVISLSGVMRSLLSGSRAGRTRAMIKRHMRPLLETGMVRTVIQLVLGVEGYAYLKQSVVDRAVAMTIGSLADTGFNHERAGLVHEVCRAGLLELPDASYRSLTRTLFDERAWVHVLVGGALGLATGLLQLGFFFRHV